jgi:hypothetical protein
MSPEKKVVPIALEAEMLDASARMIVGELLERENEDYGRGFQDGYSLCLELAGQLDSVLTRKS